MSSLRRYDRVGSRNMLYEGLAIFCSCIVFEDNHDVSCDRLLHECLRLRDMSYFVGNVKAFTFRHQCECYWEYIAVHVQFTFVADN